MNSIRESFDNLPVAVCFFDKRGVVRLMNRRMLSVGAELLGSGVQTFVIPAPLMLPLPFADAIPGRAQTMIRTNIIASDFFIFFPSFKITLI